MAWEIPNLDFSLDAGSDLSELQYRFIGVDADGNADIATGIGETGPDNVVGVLQNDPLEGEAAGIRSEGITKVVAAAAEDIDPGDFVGVNTDGEAIEVATGVYYGIALDNQDETEEHIITILLRHGYVPGA